MKLAREVAEKWLRELRTVDELTGLIEREREAGARAMLEECVRIIKTWKAVAPLLSEEQSAFEEGGEATARIGVERLRALDPAEVVRRATAGDKRERP